MHFFFIYFIQFLLHSLYFSISHSIFLFLSLPYPLFPHFLIYLFPFSHYTSFLSSLLFIIIFPIAIFLSLSLHHFLFLVSFVYSLISLHLNPFVPHFPLHSHPTFLFTFILSPHPSLFPDIRFFPSSCFSLSISSLYSLSLPSPLSLTFSALHLIFFPSSLSLSSSLFFCLSLFSFTRLHLSL